MRNSNTEWDFVNLSKLIKLSAGVYIVTGGAIKLTGTMNEREHTLQELRKLEMVRTFLLEERIVDNDGFIEYLSEV